MRVGWLLILICSIFSVSPMGSIAQKTQTSKTITYKVKSKDNWTSIARNFKVSVKDLKAENKKILNLQPGQILVIPKGASAATEKIAEHKPVEDKKEVVKKDTVEKTGIPKDTVPKVYKKEMREEGIASWIEDKDINPNKYFALHRTAPTGTVIKVINKMNRKAIFVKVVGNLPDTGDNENLLIKISKASAEKLNVRDKKFQCELSYAL